MTDEGPRRNRTGLAPAAARGRLDVLLREYEALRSEVTTRLAASATLVGFVAAAIGLAAGGRGTARWIAIAGVGAFVLVVWVGYLRQLAGLRTYLMDLESEINATTRDAYELTDDVHMLAWEHALGSKESELRRMLGRFMLMRPDDYRHRPECASRSETAGPS